MSLNLKRGVLRHDISKADYKKEPARPQTALIPPIRRASLRLGAGGGLLWPCRRPQPRHAHPAKIWLCFKPTNYLLNVTYENNRWEIGNCFMMMKIAAAVVEIEDAMQCLECRSIPLSSKLRICMHPNAAQRCNFSVICDSPISQGENGTLGRINVTCSFSPRFKKPQKLLYFFVHTNYNARSGWPIGI